jgi:hypothetical protein
MRRTPAQVAAEKKQRAALQRNLEALKAREIQLIAQMELNIQRADEEEDRRVVRTLDFDGDTAMADSDNFSDAEHSGDTDEEEEEKEEEEEEEEEGEGEEEEEEDEVVPAKNKVSLIFWCFHDEC